jgi:hypothetical protein
MRCSKTIEYPEGSTELQELLDELETPENPVNPAILHLPPSIFREIIWSLNDDLAIPITNFASAVRDKAEVLTGHFLSPPDDYHLKKGLPRYLNTKTHQRYLCRNCETFHRPGAQDTTEFGIQYTIGTKRLHGRLFNQTFYFGEVQRAIKFFSPFYEPLREIRSLQQDRVV